MKVQVIKRKCCSTVYAMCVEPYCYTSKTWQKDLRLAIKNNESIDTVDIEDAILQKCKCDIK